MKLSWSIFRFVAIAVPRRIRAGSRPGTGLRTLAIFVASLPIRQELSCRELRLLSQTMTLACPRPWSPIRDGLYDTSSIVVGSYKVTFEKTGFETFERSSSRLRCGTSTVNAALKIGATTDEIVVNTDIPLLTTETGSQSTTCRSQVDAGCFRTSARIGRTSRF